jgi:hypothetical protein
MLFARHYGGCPPPPHGKDSGGRHSPWPSPRSEDGIRSIPHRPHAVGKRKINRRLDDRSDFSRARNSNKKEVSGPAEVGPTRNRSRPESVGWGFLDLDLHEIHPKNSRKKSSFEPSKTRTIWIEHRIRADDERKGHDQTNGWLAPRPIDDPSEGGHSWQDRTERPR